MSLHEQLHPPGLTTAAIVFLVLAGIAAAVDWGAVARRAHLVEYVAKPTTVVLLIGVALTLTPVDGLRRAYVVTALLLSLAGDVFLMLPGGEEPAASLTSARAPGPRPRPRPDSWPVWFDPFALGLAAFLLAHLDYIAAFRIDGPGLARLALAVILVLVPAVPLGIIVLRALSARGEELLRVPVAVYMAALTAMTASAVATGILVAALGGWLFLVSDAVLAWNRFVRRIPGAALITIVTYHLAQASLVLWLIR